MNYCEFPVNTFGALCRQPASIFTEIFWWKRKAWFCANHHAEAVREKADLEREMAAKASIAIPDEKVTGGSK